MSVLDSQQKQRAIEALESYLNAPAGVDSQTPLQNDIILDSNRRSLISEQLKPLLDHFLVGRVALAEFKTKVDGLNKRNNHWGFSGMKGQMFFNMLVNAATDENECKAELQTALELPTSEEIARSRLKTFASYVRRVGDELIESGGTGRQRPRETSITLFLSYFWQISAPDTWPVMYTTSCDAMTSLNLWQKNGDLAEGYLQFTRIQKELQAIYSAQTHSNYDLYQVEHVFWFIKHGGGWTGSTNGDVPSKNNADRIISTTEEITLERLPDSFAPPIVSILPKLACPDESIARAAANSGISVSRAFEKSINAALTILGYETKLLGQGAGREPDGLALNIEDSYAIIWDAKSRADSYTLGTNDRAIREYISRKSRELRRQYRNIYFLIISGSFQSDFSDTILELKMDTEVKEVCLLEAEALVAIVEYYLTNPRELSLGPDGLQRVLVSTQGIINKQVVDDFFG